MILNLFGRTEVRPYGCTRTRGLGHPRSLAPLGPLAPRALGPLSFPALLGPLATVSIAAPPSGEAIYTKRCAMCHDKSGETRAPARSGVENLTIQRILDMMTTGTKKAQAPGVSR